MNDCVVDTTHARDRAGYVRRSVQRFGKMILSGHVLAWVEANGRLPEPGMQINHHCDNRACINVDHLYEGTQADNIRDRVQRGRSAKHRPKPTHCKRGHEFTPSNTYHWRGSRFCRSCGRAAMLAYRKRKVAAA